jgi:aldose 1-epimerase
MKITKLVWMQKNELLIEQEGGDAMSRYACKTMLKEGFTIIRLTDSITGSIAEIVPEMGNNLFNFESAGHQVIHPPESLKSLTSDTFATYKCGIPILSPPNRVKNGSFIFRGKQYNLPLNEPPDHHLHGQIGSKAWEVMDSGVTEERGAYVTSRFSYSMHPEIMKYFPHPLTFTLNCRLHKGRLYLEGGIVNESQEEESPYAFGFHPYFSLPFESGEEMILRVPAAAEWPVTHEAFVTGMPAVTDFSQSLNEGVNITDFPILGCSLIELSESDRICRITLKNRGYSIAYHFDEQFPFVVLFRPDWASAFSLEPYTYVTDAFNVPYDPELTGAKGIRAGEEIRFSTSLWVETN